jgi:RNA polymerase sigma-70 factor, ECF subfamily
LVKSNQQIMEKEFTELLFQNQGIVHKICNLYFNNRNEKEDYQQELIIQLWKAFPSFNYQSKFSTWMYKVCMNAAIDIIRKEKTQPKFINFEIQDSNKIVDSSNDSNSNQEKLYQAISKLSNIDKAIMTLYLDEFSYKEIAEIIGITESSTGVKINRIRSILLKSFDNGNK